MSDLKVALVSKQFPPNSVGGIGAQCYDLASSLSKHGVHVTVFTGGSNKLSIEKFRDCLEIVRMPFPDFPPRSVWFQLRNMRILLASLKDYSIVHFVDPRDSTLMLHLLKGKLGQRIVVSIHEVPQTWLKAVVAYSSVSNWTLGDIGYYFVEYPLDALTFRSAARNSDHTVTFGFCTKRAIRDIYGLQPEKVSVIYNGIDFENIDKMVGVPEAEARIVCHCRLYLVKGVLQLIKALSLVKEKIPTVRLDIYGEGPAENKIRHTISNLDLEGHVRLKGFVPRAELLRGISAASVVVLPSFAEVGPFISALEAMAFKKAVITLDLPYAREFIHHMENGLLAMAGNSGDLAEKISLLLSDQELRHYLGQNASEYVKKHHNWDTLVQDYIRLYETLQSNT